MTNPESQLAIYFAKYEPALAKLGKSLRAKLRARLPGLFEIVYVYQSQNALVISYSPSEHGYEGLVSFGLYPSGARLFFAQGAVIIRAEAQKQRASRANEKQRKVAARGTASTTR